MEETVKEKKTILVVDDEKPIVDILLYNLEKEGYETLEANDGVTAVEIALKHMKEKMPSIRKQNPTIPQSVENIVLKATAKNPKNRYDSVREMYNDLQTAMEKDNEKRYLNGP